jgi:hypothetical protein
VLAQILSTLGVGTKDLARWCGEAEIATPGICSHLAGCKTFLRVKSADCRRVRNLRFLVIPQQSVCDQCAGVAVRNGRCSPEIP